MKLLKKIFRPFIIPIKKLNSSFFSTELIYLVIPFDEKKVLDLDRIVIYHDSKDAEKEMEYLKQFYPHVIISVEYLNFRYLDPDE